MGEHVKRERSYDNRNRQEQARRTRRRVVEAARLLFVRDGYASTTIQSLADEAGVAVQTIYASFGSKREVLKQLFDTSVVGDDEEIALIERAEWQAWEDEPDARKQVGLFARAQRAVSERAADVMHVLFAAAAADPDIAQIFEEAEAARYEDQRRLADRLSIGGALRPGLSPRRAADVVWALAGPGTYTDLVDRRGWSAGDYERWLSAQLCAALLAPSDND